MKIRQAVTRTLTYTEVTVSQGGEGYTYLVYGKSTPMKELKRIMKEGQVEEIPTIVCHVVTEKRAIDFETFINNSIIINNEEIESEEI